MDALTHAIEGYITKGHCVISDMFHLEAIRLISQNLRGAVQNTPEGREGMALGQYIAGMGFSNVGLGVVHSMAHGLSALYDTPHGVACAIILPTGLMYNKAAAGARYRAIGKAMGVARHRCDDRGRSRRRDHRRRQTAVAGCGHPPRTSTAF